MAHTEQRYHKSLHETSGLYILWYNSTYKLTLLTLGNAPQGEPTHTHPPQTIHTCLGCEFYYQAEVGI